MKGVTLGITDDFLPELKRLNLFIQGEVSNKSSMIMLLSSGKEFLSLPGSHFGSLEALTNFSACLCRCNFNSNLQCRNKQIFHLFTSWRHYHHLRATVDHIVSGVRQNSGAVNSQYNMGKNYNPSTKMVIKINWLIIGLKAH